MDSLSIVTVTKLIHEALRTSPTEGNGYGLALAGFMAMAILFGTLYVIDRHRHTKQIAALQSSRETARAKLEKLVTEKFGELAARHDKLDDSIRAEFEKDRGRINTLDSAVAGLKARLER